jgi:hypothetical protein
MLSTTFVVPAAELPLIEKNLAQCPSISLISASEFSVGTQDYFDVSVTYEELSDLYQLGSLVRRELEEGGQGRA